MSTPKKRKTLNGKKVPKTVRVSSDDRFILPDDAIELMKIHPSTFYRLANQGKIPGAVKIGESWRILAKTFWQAMEKGNT